MFTKIKKLFEVKEDDTLDYMDPDKLLKKRKKTLKDPLNEEDDFDSFEPHVNTQKAHSMDETSFQQKSFDDDSFDYEPSLNEVKIKPKPQPHSMPNPDSVLEKMRLRLISIDWNPKRHPKVVIGVGVALFAILILTFALREVPNPLIGKWKPQGKNIFLPTGDIEFAKEKFQAMGVTTMVDYDIDDTKINVIDRATNKGIVFYITGDKTIEVNLLGVKTTYKKVEK